MRRERIWVPPSLRASLRDGATDLYRHFEGREWARPGDADRAVQSMLGVFPTEWIVEIIGPDFKTLSARAIVARLEDHRG